VEENRRGGGGDRRPLNRWAAWHVEMKKIGAPGSGTRCEGGGSFDKTRASTRGLRPVSDAAHVGVLGGNGEREGGREEAGGWAGPWDGSHPSAK
jgi:hypothetical protein